MLFRLEIDMDDAQVDAHTVAGMLKQLSKDIPHFDLRDQVDEPFRMEGKNEHGEIVIRAEVLDEGFDSQKRIKKVQHTEDVLVPVRVV